MDAVSVNDTRLKNKIKSDQEVRMRAIITMTVVDIIAVLIITICVFLIWRYTTNHHFVIDYNEGNFSDSSISKLRSINIPEGYVIYYNMGNVSYKEENYDQAVSRFRKALEYQIPEGLECDVRVNLALSMIGTIDFDKSDTDEGKQEVFSQLLAARQILTEEGCAESSASSFNGHDKEAEQLKQDIDKYLSEAGIDPESSDQQSSSSDDQDSSSNESAREKQLKEDLMNDKTDNTKERQNTLDENEQNQSQSQNNNSSQREGQGYNSGGSSDEGGSSTHNKNW